ncbi:MAG: response regulator [Acidobacteriaceae bacterium]|nr:response regulator [Acidobacteriaceae bacterium]
MEDNKADVFLIREAMAAAKINADLDVLQDGEKAVQFFEQVDSDDSAACPDLVILDINLPKKHGGEVLRQMRRSCRSANVLVLAVTSSHSAIDREAMVKLGVNGYFCKPSAYDDFMKLGEVVKELLRSTPEAPAASG